MVSRPFLLPDSVDRLSVSGVDFAKFCLALILSLVFGGSRAVVVSLPICRAFICIRWLNFPKFCHALSFCYLTLSSVYWYQGFNFANIFVAAWFCLQCFVVSRQLFVT